MRNPSPNTSAGQCPVNQNTCHDEVATPLKLPDLLARNWASSSGRVCTR